MNTNRTLGFCLGLLFAPLALPAQDATNAAPAPGATNVAKVDVEKVRKDVQEYYNAREALKKMPPDEAAQKQAEMNQKRIQQLQGLSPEERRVWMQEWRKKAAPLAGAGAAERRAQMVKDRLDMLRAKKAEGKTTEAENKAIERLESMEKELKEKAAAEKAAAKPAENPAAQPDTKPAEKPAAPKS
jgi:hypothetical protein